MRKDETIMSDVVKEAAKKLGLPVIDKPLAKEVDPQNLKGLPTLKDWRKAR